MTANGIIREKVVIRTRIERKPKAQLKLHLSRELRDEIERAAAARGCSMNEEVVLRLRDSFRQASLEDRLALVEAALLKPTFAADRLTGTLARDG